MILRVGERTLTQRELNRALLARQLLLERARISLPRALERMGGLQAQYAPSMYIGLWSRVEGFERDALTRALERRTVVQATLLRSTIHLVSRVDYWPFAVATREARRMWWLRARPEPFTDREMSAAARKVRAALGDGALRRAWTSRVASQVGRKRGGAGVSGSGSGARGRSRSSSSSSLRKERRVRRSSAGATSPMRMPAKLATSARDAGPNAAR